MLKLSAASWLSSDGRKNAQDPEEPRRKKRGNPLFFMGTTHKKAVLTHTAFLFMGQYARHTNAPDNRFTVSALVMR